MTYVITYDIGTTAVKTCLFGIEKNITLIASAGKGYGLYILDDGGAEQDTGEWWNALCATTKELFIKTNIQPSQIAGISFCSQMQGLVLVDENGNPVRRPMSYMDQRAKEEIKKGMKFGIQVAGVNVFRLLKSISINCAASTSVKDPLWKYKWVENHEPELFSRVYKWLDVKEYIILRCTGRCVMTEDSAFSTLLYDTRRGKEGWSSSLCRMFGIKMEHLPEIIKSTDKAGTLTAESSAELGLAEGTPVFGGGGDASLIGIGAGCTTAGSTHIYSGTSGWVSTVTDYQTVDPMTEIAAIVGAQHRRFNYFAEMETAGKCLEWVKDHLALDEIGIYLKKVHVAEGPEAVNTSLYDYLTQTVAKSVPGAGGVIFTPWLHGNRCPFEDPNSAGMFFNIKLETGKTELIRAVLEGVCYHLRWMLECEERRVQTSRTIRFVGGGALSPVTSQILADITGRTIEVVDNPQNVGAVGAAAVICVGLGIISSFDAVGTLIPAAKVFVPDAQQKVVYDRIYAVFKKLYRVNKDNFAALNS
jgi:xylulokinase